MRVYIAVLFVSLFLAPAGFAQESDESVEASDKKDKPSLRERLKKAERGRFDRRKFDRKVYKYNKEANRQIGIKRTRDKRNVITHRKKNVKRNRDRRNKVTVYNRTKGQTTFGSKVIDDLKFKDDVEYVESKPNVDLKPENDD